MKANKIPAMNWEKFEAIPFAVVFYSTELGWLTMSHPNSPATARDAYVACDSQKKMLLNYGMILCQTTEANEQLTKAAQ